MSTQVELSFISQNDTRKGHGLTSAIKNLPGDTMLLVSDQERASELTNIAHLTERLDYKEGRDNSMCNVWFADVKMDATDGTTLAVQPIAIKPLSEAWLAAREFRTAKRLNRDAQRTFRPLGFLSMGGKSPPLPSLKKVLPVLIISCGDVINYKKKRFTGRLAAQRRGSLAFTPRGTHTAITK